MKILSIDVGIKNLAFCLFNREDESNDFHIEKWDIVNLSEKLENICSEVEKFKQCNKPAKFSKNGKCYCIKHSKKQQFQIPTSDLKPSSINKEKIKGLYELAEKYKIKYENPIKKAELISIINNYVFEKCFDSIEKKNASKIDLITVRRNIKSKLDTILNNHIDTITHVVIENQISPIANRMKTIQGMIAQYFIMNNENIHIEFVSASNKLKDFKTEKTEKTKYSDRKKQSIQECLQIVTNQLNYCSWETFFKNHSKKDDLADSFLQGIWYISNKL